jgi:chaperonin cofactor prefoldin
MRLKWYRKLEDDAVVLRKLRDEIKEKEEELLIAKKEIEGLNTQNKSVNESLNNLKVKIITMIMEF